jgi:hypothetical protein
MWHYKNKKKNDMLSEGDGIQETLGKTQTEALLMVGGFQLNQ